MMALSEKCKTEEAALDVDHFRQALLAWYRLNARQMPWRAPPGEFPDPYHEWLSEIMLQQTVVKAVIPYFLKFIALWPSVNHLAAAPLDDVLKEWAGLGYYARARNLHKCAKVIAAEYGGVFPPAAEELVKLPGIGPYTAAAIAAIAFNRPSSVMDGNVERVMARLHAHPVPLKDSKKQLYTYVEGLTTARTDHPGDFAQALMELGAVICTPTSPKCGVCPVQRFCKAYAYQLQGQLPVPSVKKVTPVRYGTAFFIENEKGEILFERRTDDGLLGGMTGLPGTLWNEDTDKNATCTFHHGNVTLSTSKDLEIKHVFTHFKLILKGACAKIDKASLTLRPQEFWYPKQHYNNAGLPNLYKKIMMLYFKYDLEKVK